MLALLCSSLKKPYPHTMAANSNSRVQQSKNKLAAISPPSTLTDLIMTTMTEIQNLISVKRLKAKNSFQHPLFDGMNPQSSGGAIFNVCLIITLYEKESV